MKKFKDILKKDSDKEKAMVEYLKGPGKNIVYDGYLDIIFEVDSVATFLKYVDIVKDIQIGNTWAPTLGRGIGAVRIIYRDVWDDYVSHVLETLYTYKTENPITPKQLEEISSVIQYSDRNKPKKLLDAMRHYGAKDLLY